MNDYGKQVLGKRWAYDAAYISIIDSKYMYIYMGFYIYIYKALLQPHTHILTHLPQNHPSNLLKLAKKNAGHVNARLSAVSSHHSLLPFLTGQHGCREYEWLIHHHPFMVKGSWTLSVARFSTRQLICKVQKVANSAVMPLPSVKVVSQE